MSLFRMRKHWLCWLGFHRWSNLYRGRGIFLRHVGYFCPRCESKMYDDMDRIE